MSQPVKSRRPMVITIVAVVVVVAVVFLLIALISDSLWAVAAGSARQWFARSPRRLSTVEATGGALMIGLGGTLALTGTKS